MIGMHRTLEELAAAVAHIQAAPKEAGVVKLIVSRPGVDRREVCAPLFDRDNRPDAQIYLRSHGQRSQASVVRA